MVLTKAFQDEEITWQRLLRRLGPELDEAIDIEVRTPGNVEGKVFTT